MQFVQDIIKNTRHLAANSYRLMGVSDFREKRTFSWCSENWLFLASIIALLVFANLFLFWYLRQERFIYFWDLSYYEWQFRFMVHRFQEGFLSGLFSLFLSVLLTEHSFLAATFLAPLGLLFGTERSVYLFAVLNMFAIPAAILIGAVFARAVALTGERRVIFAIIPILVLFAPPQFWLPIVRGFHDV